MNDEEPKFENPMTFHLIHIVKITVQMCFILHTDAIAQFQQSFCIFIQLLYSQTKGVERGGIYSLFHTKYLEDNKDN